MRWLDDSVFSDLKTSGRRYESGRCFGVYTYIPKAFASAEVSSMQDFVVEEELARRWLCLLC